MPWGRAALVLAVIAGAHLGLFLLLTASARGEAAAIEARHGALALETAEDPGARPSETRAVARWHRRQTVWEDARTLRDHRASIRLLGVSLLGSFFLQAGILAVLLHRSVASGRRARAGRRPSREARSTARSQHVGRGR